MIDYEKYEEKYPEIAEKIYRLRTDGFLLTETKDGLEISSPDSNITILLKKSHLNQLENYKKISGIKGLIYYNHCGFSYYNYSEFFISIQHPEYILFDLVPGSVWPATKPLKFRIDEVLITVDSASSLIVLLMEPYYSNSEFYPSGFSSLASIKILSNKEIKHKEFFHKALFYLNSHYLKSLGIYASLHHVEHNLEDPLNIYSNEPKKQFGKIARSVIRTRKNLKSCEPLILYNRSQEIENEEKFLALYRILEFFFNRNKLQKIDNLRYDPKASNEEILDIVTLKNELDHLTSLLDEITTPSLKKKLIKYAKHHDLIKNEKFSALSHELYLFRNSIVHAKESELKKTEIPNPFNKNLKVEKWIYIIRELAEKAINKIKYIRNIITFMLRDLQNLFWLRPQGRSCAFIML